MSRGRRGPEGEDQGGCLEGSTGWTRSWTLTPSETQTPYARTAAEQTGERMEKSYTLVLGGGAHLGAVQAGQLHALAEANVNIDRIIGVSVGALNGAFVSRGLNADTTGRLVELWRDAANERLFDRGMRRFLRVLLREGALSGNDRLRNFAEMACPERRLENFPIPTEVVTCNLTSGAACYHQQGDAVELVVASCSMPGIFPPVMIEGERHVDGGVLDLLPWRRAGEREALVLDCRGGGRWSSGEGETALSVLLSSFALARRHRAYDGLDLQENLTIVPGPEIGKDVSLRKAGELIEDSYRITKEFIANGGLGRTEPVGRRWRLRRGFWAGRS